MREAVKLALGYGFHERGLNRVQATTLTDNDRSKALLKAHGFTQEGVLREYGFIGGRYRDMCSFSLLRREWEARTW